RPYEDIAVAWSQFHIIHLRAELEEPLINSDIALYVSSEVERLKRLRNYSEDLTHKVKMALITGADGMFLWTALMIQILESTPVSRVQETLKKLPRGIDALYDRILAEIPEDALETVSTILKWAVFAARPLTVPELGIACAMDSVAYKSLASIPEEIINGIRGDLALCSPILKIKENSVHLVHQTTKEYLLRRSTTDLAFERLLESPQQAHSCMALTCLTFLAFEEIDQALIGSEFYDRMYYLIYTTLPGIPFFEYAGWHWASHLRESGPLSDKGDLLKTLLVVLDSVSRRTVLERILIIQSPDQEFETIEYGCTALHVLIDGDCELAAEAFTRAQQFNASDKDRSGRCLLHVAAERGYTRLIQILLDRGGDPNLIQSLESGSESHALYLAAAKGHESAVEVLRQNGANPDTRNTIVEFRIRDSSGRTRITRARTALHASILGNHESIVKLLVNSKADINCWETRRESHPLFFGSSAELEEKWTALHIANTLHQTATVKLLLDNGATTVKTEDGKTVAPYELKCKGPETLRLHYGMTPHPGKTQ
ncbi:hypothetical protein IL306_011134, partial [Fusarium sp. DS 682]